MSKIKFEGYHWVFREVGVSDPGRETISTKCNCDTGHRTELSFTRRKAEKNMISVLGASAIY